MSDASQLRDYWEKEYECTTTQFDVDEPEEWIVDLEKQGKIRGHVFDSGCGPGRTSLYLAGLGYNVTGADISNNVIERAKQKAAEKQDKVQFLQADVCSLTGYEKSFDTVIDIGCFHSLFDDSARSAYAAALHRICREGSVIYLRAFSDANVHSARRGLPALREEQIRIPFTSNGWNIQDLAHREIDLLVANNQRKKGFCWFAEMKYGKGQETETVRKT